MRRVRIYLVFFRRVFSLPLAFSFFILVTTSSFVQVIFALLFSMIVIWAYNHFLQDPKKQKMYFFYNLGISELKLYAVAFIINLCILLISKPFV